MCVQMPAASSERLPCTELQGHLPMVFQAFGEQMISSAASMKAASLQAIKTRRTAVLHPSEGPEQPTRYAFV